MNIYGFCDLKNRRLKPRDFLNENVGRFSQIAGAAHKQLRVDVVPTETHSEMQLCVLRDSATSIRFQVNRDLFNQKDDCRNDELTLLVLWAMCAGILRSWYLFERNYDVSLLVPIRIHRLHGYLEFVRQLTDSYVTASKTEEQILLASDVSFIARYVNDYVDWHNQRNCDFEPYDLARTIFHPRRRNWRHLKHFNTLVL